MSGPFYSYGTGTISIAGGSTSLVGVLTAWATTVKAGDQILAKISLGGSPETFRLEPLGPVATVDSNLGITLQVQYDGDDIDDATYIIVRGIAWLAGAAANETMVTLITELGAMGLAGVTSGAPDPEEGRESELRVDEVSGVIYQKRAGVWVVAASGFTWDAIGDVTGSPSDRDQYDAEAADFTFFSISEVGFYVKLSATSGDWSDLISIRGPTGAGDIAAISASITGRPSAGEVVAVHVFVDDITFPAGLSTSRAKARIAATAEAEFSLTKNGVEFGTVTFAIGGDTGTFVAPSETVFEDGDELDIVCPNPRDDTLDGIKITLRGTR